MVPLLLAGGMSLVMSLLGTRYLIGWLRAHRVGQPQALPSFAEASKSPNPSDGERLDGSAARNNNFALPRRKGK